MCAVFVCFSLSLLSGLSHQDYSSILLSFPNTIAKGCVLSFPLAFSVPTNQQLLCQTRCPSSGRDSESPPPLLLVVTSVPCSSDNCWDVWSSHLCSVLFLSLTPCRSPFQKSLLQLFLSLNIKKKSHCVWNLCTFISSLQHLFVVFHRCIVDLFG